jgi:hypothetical protein
MVNDDGSLQEYGVTLTRRDAIEDSTSSSDEEKISEEEESTDVT